MDLASLDLRAAVSAGAEFELRHPGTGEGIGIFLTVIGYDSETVENARKAVRKRAMRAKDKDEAAKILEGSRVAMAQAALTDHRGDTGEPKTLDDMRKLIADPGWLWVVEQIEAFAGDRASFFKSAGTA